MERNRVPSKPVILGKIGSSYGIYGAMKIFSYTERPENIFEYHPWFSNKSGRWKEIKLASWYYRNNNLIIRLIGVCDRDSARFFTNSFITVDASHLPPSREDDYYWKDLMGCEVFNTQEYNLGKVIDVMETGANDVLVVKACLADAYGIKERLIPFLDERVIKKVELTKSTIRVDWDPIF